MKCITLASVILVFLAVNGVQSLKCYTCSSNAAAPNFKCENDAMNVSLVECSPQMVYCLTMITESATLGLIFSPMNRSLIWSNEPVIFLSWTAGQVNATLRTCTDEQLYTNGLHEFDGNITVNYRTCQRDGCNVAPSVRAGELPFLSKCRDKR
jgi:hypothetical protein